MFLVWSWTAPEGRIVRVGESGLDVALMGWVALALGIWNTVRWWLSRTYAARRREQPEEAFTVEAEERIVGAGARPRDPVAGLLVPRVAQAHSGATRTQRGSATSSISWNTTRTCSPIVIVAGSTSLMSPSAVATRLPT